MRLVTTMLLFLGQARASISSTSADFNVEFQVKPNDATVPRKLNMLMWDDDQLDLQFKMHGHLRKREDQEDTARDSS